jgi:tetraacyldisaccharide 4'-kinase
MIPSGERREPVSALLRAHVVALSRSDEDTGWWKRRPEYFSRPLLRYRYKIDRVVRLGDDGQRSTAAAIAKERVFAFSGIGDHEEFVNQTRAAHFNVVGNMGFPDHHTYTADDLARVLSRATEVGAGALLTTEKDTSRLSADLRLLRDLLLRISLFSVGIVVDIVEGREMLNSMVDECLLGRTA